MKRKIIVTADGSHSVYVTDSGLAYHSKYGAIQESMHVFIDAGLKPLLALEQTLTIFEMGFGTGLNALLTILNSEKEKKIIYYQAIESHPLEKSFIEKINYCDQLNRPDLQNIFEQMHNCPWEKDISITPFFILHKANADLINYQIEKPIQLVYFDAFDPSAQPELWTEPIFKKIYKALMPGGMLLTYSSKSVVRKAMEAVGFTVEKLNGPPHKREILRAVKK